MISHFLDVIHKLKNNFLVSSNMRITKKRTYEIMTDIAEYLVSRNKNVFLALEKDYVMLIKLKKLTDCKSLIRPEIKAMMNYDIENKCDLCLTLYTYLCCNHSLKKTSEILFMHSNTIFYRIQKARDEFGVEFDKPELHFAYIFSLALVLLKNGNDELFICDK